MTIENEFSGEFGQFANKYFFSYEENIRPPKEEKDHLKSSLKKYQNIPSISHEASTVPERKYTEIEKNINYFGL